MYYWQFSKNFPLPKNGGHFEFSKFWKKWKNTNLLLSPEPCDIERFRRNFRSIGYLINILLAIFKKFSSHQKWRPFEFFEFLPKMEKHKFASISLTVQDRAISLKFQTTGYPRNVPLAIFKKKIFLSQKMAAILNFRIFGKNGKTLICFYLLNHVR